MKKQAFEVIVRVETTVPENGQNYPEEVVNTVSEIINLANTAMQERGGGGLDRDGITMTAVSAKEV
jgi:hypothetical protein